MTDVQIAEMIPAQYRRQLLEENWIAFAQPLEANQMMRDLITIYKTYINPHEVINCPLCYARILNNYKQIQHILVELERKSRLINSA